MSQPELFVDPAAQRERITAAIVARFATYGDGTAPNSNNATANTLAKQEPTFAFGVPVKAVVDAVCDMMEE